jgi:hypothetical protein
MRGKNMNIHSNKCVYTRKEGKQLKLKMAKIQSGKLKLCSSSCDNITYDDPFKHVNNFHTDKYERW